MITAFTLQQLASRYGGEILEGSSSALITSVATDTRQLVKGDCFVALQGDRFDAHDYLQEALDKGVTAIVINKASLHKLPQIKKISVWLVDDTTRALGRIAEYQRDHFKHPLVAITGSSGKTTVKGMLAKIFSVYVGEDAVFATKGNFNNHIGVPLSLLSINKNHQYAVIEMGASGPREIEYLTIMAKPTIALITNVMAAHVEGFGSIDAIATAKSEIYQGLNENGIAIINADDVYATQWLEQVESQPTLIFSVSKKIAEIIPNSKSLSQIHANNISLLKNGCYSFRLTCGDTATVVELNVFGKHNIANAVAAAACAYGAGLDIEFIQKGLESFRGDPGRLQLIEGYKDCTLIDDTYNANPGSVRAAIDVLAEIAGPTILVLGDMAELGNDAGLQHKEIGRYALTKGIGQLFTLGENSALAANAFGEKATHCSTFEYLIDCLVRQISSDVTILVKGSRSSRMERVIHALTSSGDNNATLAC